MTKELLFSTMVSVGLAFAPEAMAQTTSMDKPAMKGDKMMDKKADGMAKPAADKMKSNAMKKDKMSSDKMKQ
jgi:pentapeptide MXKDX repeat protein